MARKFLGIRGKPAMKAALRIESKFDNFLWTNRSVRSTRTSSLFLGALIGAFCLPAFATPVANLPLDFSSIALTTNAPSSFGSGAKVAGPGAIAAAINAQLPAGDSVTMTGGVATNSYAGEGHVVGNTLAATAPGHIFIINDSFGIYAGSPNFSPKDSFTISLNGFTLSSIKFDYEIFPDASCAYSTSLSSCYKQGPSNANWPDIGISINGSTTEIWNANATIPSPGKDPQALVFGQIVNFPTAATSITFWDWPATIGVADIRLNVPEPGSLALVFAAGLAGLGFSRRKRAH
jgi:hypothetical protein